MSAEPQWVVISIAHGEERAKTIQSLLSGEGFMARLRRITRAAASGECCYEVLALPCEAKEARDMLLEHGI